MIINYYYKQHITRQQYKSGMCIYLPNEKVSILARFNQKKKKIKWFEYLQLTNHYTLQHIANK